MDIILYTTNCPRCNVLKTKLKTANIEFTENHSVDEMLSLGITQAPMLSVNEKLFDFKQAIDWLKGEVTQ